ncbi:hypothetical protein Bpfe_031326 [Biomphalaria pfeifferi]|uniref:Uncharacterized protein n=1 Tax=Biomphalaria pfeifferi TaxID=112525 RepID=A0AAD8AMW7_BIOPF|nr:hypothetical protein Bpfe_031326 [Biomphalaria pfeifferi]
MNETEQSRAENDQRKRNVKNENRQKRERGDHDGKPIFERLRADLDDCFDNDGNDDGFQSVQNRRNFRDISETNINI